MEIKMTLSHANVLADPEGTECHCLKTEGGDTVLVPVSLLPEAFRRAARDFRLESMGEGFPVEMTLSWPG